MGSPLRCFSFSYYGFLPLGASSPLTSMPTCSFYSELIQCDFSLLPLGLHQLFLACCGHSFRITHQSIGCLATTYAQIRLLRHYLFDDKIPFCLFLLYTFTSRFKWIRIGLPHHLPLWHASDGPSHLLPFLGKISSQQGIFPKEVTTRNQI